MNTLIPVTNSIINGERVPSVNARELHVFLEVGKVFAAWIQERISQYGFIENQDFIVFSDFGKNPEGGRPTKEYAITLDMAKELAMVERNEKGRQARKYFIECEKKLKEGPVYHQSKPLLSDLIYRLPEYVDRIKLVYPSLGESSIQEIISRMINTDAGQNLLPQPKIEEAFYTTSAIAEEAGVSPQRAGKVAVKFNLKTKEHGEVRLSNAKHNDKQVVQFYWNEKGRIALLECLR